MVTAEISKIGKQSLSTIGSLLNKKPESVVSVSKEGKEWKVLAEVLERRAVPDTQDILGRYEMRLNEEGELLGYKQVMTRRRADLIVEEE
ncbi:MAG: gas vesicle protein GvpO [Candidatus Thermoplasmatota archaeon]|nr:gas vesicle protein GvpO [Candidatus Thermoplasmatota archaeon]MDI6855284.1 gas vesicle protein GvpO [Candidatus Thermoplasmatota archaeon]